MSSSSIPTLQPAPESAPPPVVDAVRARELADEMLAERLPVQIWTALPDGRLDFVSEQTSVRLGLSSEQLLADGWQSVLHPDDVARAVTYWTHALKMGEPYEVEFRLKLANGEYAWHLARAVPRRSPTGEIVRWFGTNTNIEAHRAREREVEALLDEVKAQAERLREQNRLLALEAEIGVTLARAATLDEILSACTDSLVKHLDAAFARIWVVDDAGSMLVLRASSGLYTHLDGPHGRVPVGQFKIGQIAAERTPHLTNAVVGDPRVSDQDWAARERMVSFAGFPLLLGEKLVGVVAAFARHPLSQTALGALGSVANTVAQAIERFRAEEARAQGEAERAVLLSDAVRARNDLAATLEDRERLLAVAEDAREKAEIASRAKDEFLATASHELRTPLNAILGWARMLRSGSLEKTAAARGLETIERNAKAQVQLIEDILDGSRIITGKLHLDVRSIDLRGVVEVALDAVRPAAIAKSIRLDMAVEPAASRIKGDPDRLQQVVWNLLNNAIKFTSKGGRVEIRVARVGTHIELAVTDTGQGISEDFLPHVFERFRQADASTTRRHGGLGLGLALVRHLVEAHGGTVRAESDGEGLGSTFTVALPVQAVYPESVESVRLTPVSEAALAAPAPHSLAGVVVLVIDDEPDARDLVATVLRVEGAEVLVATSVEGAIDMIADRSPALLISDIGMPGADGYTLIQRVRRIPSDVPAVALTAYARDEDRRRALAAGFQAHVAKPVEPTELVRLVMSLARVGTAT